MEININQHFDKLAQQFQLKTENKELFIEALTHSSYTHLYGVKNNERLEFLGDSVLGMIVCRYLYEKYPEFQEGELTKIKTVAVSTGIWALFARELELDRFLITGDEEFRKIDRVLAGLFEAFMGAYFLTFGLEKLTELFLPLLDKNMNVVLDKRQEALRKNTLQELIQAGGKNEPPQYRVLSREGPVHLPFFRVGVSVNGEIVAEGTGHSIKEAENNAAAAALQILSDKS